MDFQLSEEQSLLRESIDRFIRDDYSLAQRSKYLQENSGWSRRIWSGFAEMGVLGLLVGEDYGGVGGNTVDLMLVMESFGRGLVVEPYLATSVLSVDLINRLGNEQQKSDTLPAISSGAMQLALAHFERESRYDVGHVGVTAERGAAGWKLNGHKAQVLNGSSADILLVSAKTAGGVTLFLVPREAPGVSCLPYKLQDAHAAADIDLVNVQIPLAAMLGEDGAALSAIERAVERGIAAICAEAVGAMTAMTEMTIEYLRTRKQFGVAIGSFQALQHRVADMAVALEQAKSMALYAGMMADHPDADERRRALSAAKVQICTSCRYVGQQAIQLHGGMGVTMDHDVGRYFMRTSMIQLQFGDHAYHLARLSALGGLIAPADLV